MTSLPVLPLETIDQFNKLPKLPAIPELPEFSAKLPAIPELPQFHPKLPPLEQLRPLAPLPNLPIFENNSIQYVPEIVLNSHELKSLERAAKKNPIQTLLSENKLKKNDLSGNIVSVVMSIIAFLAFGVSCFALYYVFSRTPLFSNLSATGTAILKSSTIINEVDLHYICIPGNAGMTLTLPPPQNKGDFVSASLPLAIGESPDSRSLSVTWTNDNGTKTTSISQNSGALFMVASELGELRWKIIRQWS